jgi:hypothetical protein
MRQFWVPLYYCIFVQLHRYKSMYTCFYYMENIWGLKLDLSPHTNGNSILWVRKLICHCMVTNKPKGLISVPNESINDWIKSVYTLGFVSSGHWLALSLFQLLWVDDGWRRILRYWAVREIGEAKKNFACSASLTLWPPLINPGSPTAQDNRCDCVSRRLFL